LLAKARTRRFQALAAYFSRFSPRGEFFCLLFLLIKKSKARQRKPERRQRFKKHHKKSKKTETKQLPKT
jgi:hypothetical protein